MRVNPELLRGFAHQVDLAADMIKAADTGRTASAAADGLAGSTTQWAARLVGEHMATVEARITSNVVGMGVAVRGAGGRYEVEDTALARALDRVF